MVDSLPPLLASYPEYVLLLISSLSGPSAAPTIAPLARAPIEVVTQAAPVLNSTLAQPDDSEGDVISSPILSAFWQQHNGLHGFLLVSLSSFTPTVKGCPSFTTPTVADPAVVPGHYMVNLLGLHVHRDKRWVLVYSFQSSEISPEFSPIKTSVYFKVT